MGETSGGSRPSKKRHSRSTSQRKHKKRNSREKGSSRSSRHSSVHKRHKRSASVDFDSEDSTHRKDSSQPSGDFNDDGKRESNNETHEAERSPSPAVKLPSDEELRNIASYVDDRSAIVRHMFASLSKVELRSLLPDSLKNLPLNELQGLCAEELEGMSKKRILSIIEGRELLESSDSSERESDTAGSDSNDEEARKPASSRKSGRAEIAVADSTTEICVDEPSGSDTGQRGHRQRSSTNADSEVASAAEAKAAEVSTVVRSKDSEPSIVCFADITVPEVVERTSSIHSRCLTSETAKEVRELSEADSLSGPSLPTAKNSNITRVARAERPERIDDATSTETALDNKTELEEGEVVSDEEAAMSRGTNDVTAKVDAQTDTRLSTLRSKGAEVSRQGSAEDCQRGTVVLKELVRPEDASEVADASVLSRPKSRPPALQPHVGLNRLCEKQQVETLSTGKADGGSETRMRTQLEATSCATTSSLDRRPTSHKIVRRASQPAAERRSSVEESKVGAAAKAQSEDNAQGALEPSGSLGLLELELRERVLQSLLKRTNVPS